MKKNSILFSILAVVIIILVLGGLYFIYQQSQIPKTNAQPKQNTQPAQQQPVVTQPKQLSPGTIKPIGQTGTPTTTWKTFQDAYGFQMQYPADATILSAPTSEKITCDNACPQDLKVNGIESVHADEAVNGVNYCIYSGSNSAAGQSHNEYLFVTVKNNSCYGLDISYTVPNCDNYTTGTAAQDCKSKQSDDQILRVQAVSSIKFSAK